MDPLTEKIIGTAIEVHKTLGCGLLESIYKEAMCIELADRNMCVEREVSIDIVYKGHIIKGQRLDLLVEKQVIIELKSLLSLPDVAMAQVLSYLKATGLKRALLINFGEKRLINGIKRVSL